MKIVVLGGGVSTERQVSLVTSFSVCRALRERGHKAIFADMYFGMEEYDKPLAEAFDEPDGFCGGEVSIQKTAPDIAEVAAARRLKGPRRIGAGVLELCTLADCVFLGLHGADGEDGRIQGALDLLGVPYTGSGCLGSALALDKAMAKRIMEGAGVLTPRWREITYTETDIPALAGELSVPCVVKVVNGGSSIGIQMPETREELEQALRGLLCYGGRIIAEEKITGREITVPVLGDRYLNAIEIVPPESGKFDYVSKYQSGKDGAAELCPARITEAEHRMLGETALRLHRAMGLSVYSRTDFILDGEGRAWCLEVNTLPGMTPNSLFPKAAKVDGMDYGTLCERIIELSLRKGKEENVVKAGIL